MGQKFNSMVSWKQQTSKYGRFKSSTELMLYCLILADYFFFYLILFYLLVGWVCEENLIRHFIKV